MTMVLAAPCAGSGADSYAGQVDLAGSQGNGREEHAGTLDLEAAQSSPAAVAGNCHMQAQRQERLGSRAGHRVLENVGGLEIAPQDLVAVVHTQIAVAGTEEAGRETDFVAVVSEVVVVVVAVVAAVAVEEELVLQTALARQLTFQSCSHGRDGEKVVSIRRKATWKFSAWFCALSRQYDLTSKIFHHRSVVRVKRHIMEVFSTYPEDGRIIRHLWWPILLGRGGRGHNDQLFHIAAAEDDVFIYIVGGWDLVGRVTEAAFSSVGRD